MTRVCALGMFLALAAVAQANPIFRDRPPGAGPFAQVVICAVALALEAVVVVRLAGRERRQRDAVVWFCITVATFLLFIAVPLARSQPEYRSSGDPFSDLILLLELVTVVFEAGILWALWLRKENRSAPSSLVRSLWISLLGNLVSYGVSVLGLSAAY